MDQELQDTAAYVLGRHFVCIHQMAALFCVTWHLLLLLDGVLLLEHSGVDKNMPLLTICSTVPSRVNANMTPWSPYWKCDIKINGKPDFNNQCTFNAKNTAAKFQPIGLESMEPYTHDTQLMNSICLRNRCHKSTPFSGGAGFWSVCHGYKAFV